VGLVLAFSFVVGISGMALSNRSGALLVLGRGNSQSENDLNDEDFSEYKD